MSKIKVCRDLKYLPHVPKLSMAQFSVLVIMYNNTSGTTTRDISDILGYDCNEVTKIISNLSTPLAKRENLILGERAGSGAGNPKVWTLTKFAKNLVKTYEEGIID